MILRLAVASGVLLGVAVAAGPTDAQSLEEALIAAYLRNPQLEAQRARLRQTDEQVPQALSGWRPNAELFGSLGGVRRNLDRLDDQSLFQREIGGRIVQPVFRGGQTVAATRRAENAVRADRAELIAVEQAVLRDGTIAYVNVLAAQAVLEFEIQNEQRLARFLQATRDRFEVGEVTRTDLFQAEARLARATADRVRAEGDLESARGQYRNVIGESPGLLEFPKVPENLPGDLDAATALASDNNPTVIQAEYAERSARDGVDQTRGELLPQVSVIGEASHGEDIFSKDTSGQEYRATLDVTIPLYQAGLVYSRLREAKQGVTEALRRVDDARREAVRAATTAWSQFEAAKARVKAFTTEVSANEVAVEGAEREQAVGTRTVLDVLDTQQDLIDSQRNLVVARRDEIRFAAELKEAMGQLTARQLGLAVGYYDPALHYDEVRGRWFGGSSCGDINDPACAAAPAR